MASAFMTTPILRDRAPGVAVHPLKRLSLVTTRVPLPAPPECGDAPIVGHETARLFRFELVDARLERADPRLELSVAIGDRLCVTDHEPVLLREVENRSFDEVQSLVGGVEPLVGGIESKVGVFPEVVYLRANATNPIPNVLQDLDRQIASGHRHLLSG